MTPYGEDNVLHELRVFQRGLPPLGGVTLVEIG